MYHHRSGKLKQQNKTHKSDAGRASKRGVDRTNHGRVEAVTTSVKHAAPDAKKVGPKAVPSAEMQGRAMRANLAKQLKEKRKEELAVRKRIGGGYGPSKVVAVVPLSSTASAVGAAAQLLSLADVVCAHSDTEGIPGAPVSATYASLKQRLLVTVPPRAGQTAAEVPGFTYDVTHTLASVRCADVLVLVVSVAGWSSTTAAAAALAAAPPASVIGSTAGFASASAAGSHGFGGPSAAGAASGKAASAAESHGAVLVDGEGETFLACLKATGVPTVIGVVQGLDTLPVAKAGDARKFAHRLFADEFGEGQVKVIEAGIASDPLAAALGIQQTPAAAAATAAGAAGAAAPVTINGALVPAALAPVVSSWGNGDLPATRSGPSLALVRAVTSAPDAAITWRGNRSYMVAQQAVFTPAAPPPPPPPTAAADAGAAAAGGGDAVGTLRLYGYLRGRPLNAGQLVCLPSGGVYAISHVTAAEDPSRQVAAAAAKRKAAAAALAAVGTAADAVAAAASGSAVSYAVAASGGTAVLLTPPSSDDVAGAGVAPSSAHAARLPRYQAAGAPFVPLLVSLGPLTAKVLAVDAVGAGAPAAAAAAAGGDGTGEAAGEATTDATGEVVLAAVPPEAREPLGRVAEAEDGGDAEQAWGDLVHDHHSASDGGGAAGAGVRLDAGGDDGGKAAGGGRGIGGVAKSVRSARTGGSTGTGIRRPKGMSSTHAAWLVDEDDEEEDDEEEDEEAGAAAAAGAASCGGKRAAGGMVDSDDDHDAAAAGGDEDEEEWTDGEGEDDDGDGDDSAEARAARAAKRKQHASQERDELKKLRARRRRRKLRALAGAAGGKGVAGVASDSDDEEEEDAGADGDDDDGLDGGVSVAASTIAGGSSSGRDPLARKRAAAAEEAVFPDEVQTPSDVPARERFGRYRGLKSLRTSPWHPKEALPSAYSRIYGLEHFRAVQAAVLAEAELPDKAQHTLVAQRVAAERLSKRAERHADAAKALASRHGAAGTGGTPGSSVVGGASASAMRDADEDEEEDGIMTAAGSSSSGPRGRALSSGASTLGGGALTAAGSTSGGPHHDALADLLGAGWVSSNAFLCVVVEGVPRSALHDAAVPGVPLTMFSLLRHENRASVVHYALTRTSNYADPIASKEDLEFHVGNRVFDARPLFSSGGGGSRTASNAALEAGQGPRAQLDRFFAPGQWTTATAYAPITYAPMPVLVFKRLPLVAAGPASGGEVVPAAPSEVTAFPTTGEELAALAPLYPAPDRIHQVPACTRFRLVLVAVGSVSCADPDRLVIKRIVLSGFPISVKGRTATVKHMFYSPTDVDYFKKLEVYTKHGRHGNIVESLGTHGKMKVTFDRGIKQHDTVCMPLYKRVFPRWGACYRADVGALDEHAAEDEFRRGFAHEEEEAAE